MNLRFVRPPDVALLLLALAAGAWSTAHPRGGRAAKATVYVEGRRIAWFDLAGPTRRDTVATPLGRLVLEFGTGRIRILQASCPQKLCVKAGAAAHAGAHIVCVPARTVLVVEGGDEEGYDAVQ